MKNPEKYFDQIIEMDLDVLEPQVCGPFTPDLVRSVSELKKEEAKNKRIEKIIEVGNEAIFEFDKNVQFFI